MTLAIRGDRASCLSLQLGPRTWLLAVARGFGSVGELATEAALLSRLRSECERRARSARFRRAIDRPQAAATAVLAILTRVNCDLYSSTASHEDYVTAAASLTAVIVVAGRAFVMQAGSTAAYLARDGEIAALSADELFEGAGRPLLFRALATAPALDVAISSTALAQGDVIVLLDRRLRSSAERTSLLDRLASADPGEHVLVARIERDEPPLQEGRTGGRLDASVVCLLAALLFLLAIIFTR
jgi:hypothetical protein